MTTKVLITGMTTNYGGVEASLFNYVSRMQGKIQFDFWCNNNCCAFEEKLTALGCHIFHGAAYGNNPVKALTDMTRFFEQHGKEYNILWNNASMLVHIDELKLAKRVGIPRIILHSHNSRDMFSGLSGKMKSLLHKVNRRSANHLATDYWACSYDAGLYFFTKKNMSSERYAFIPNAIDTHKFAFNEEIRQAKRRELGIATHTTVVGFVGRLQYQKDPELLMHIFAEYHHMNPDSVLLVVGTGELQEQCERINQESGTTDAVRFLGARKDVAQLYQVMDIFCLPSRFEGLPVVLVEAQAAGLPCIVSDTITNEIALTPLLQPMSRNAKPESWAQKIASSINNSDTSTRLSACAQVAEAGFDINQAAHALVCRLLEQ